MKTLTIVKDLNELKDSDAGSLVSGKGEQIGQFGTQGAEKTLHHGIVIRIAFAAHAELNVMSGKQRTIVFSRVLATTICMVNERGLRSEMALSECHLQGMGHQCLIAGGA